MIEHGIVALTLVLATGIAARWLAWRLRVPAILVDSEPAGFRWIDCSDAENSVLSLLRRSRKAGEEVLVVLNFTPQPHSGYRVGAPGPGFWAEVLNSDAPAYGGGGWGNLGGVGAAPVGRHGQPFSLTLTLPPLSAVFLRRCSTGA